MSETLLVDTGAWLALFDPRDEYHDMVSDVSELIESAQLVVPWPITYEMLRTRFVRRPEWVAALHQRLTKPSVTFIDDVEYREQAYSLTVGGSLQNQRHLSMVDVLCRILIDDPKIDIKYLLTVNKKDFLDVCLKNSVEIWP